MTTETKKQVRKIRDAELKKIPFMLVVGENEEQNGTISVRRRGEGDLGAMKLEDFVTYFKESNKNLRNFRFNYRRIFVLI